MKFGKRLVLLSILLMLGLDSVGAVRGGHDIDDDEDDEEMMEEMRHRHERDRDIRGRGDDLEADRRR